MSYSLIAIIYNPKSTGPSEAIARKFADSLSKTSPKPEVKLVATEHAGHGEELAYQLALDHPQSLIISSSGDGGYNDVVNGVMRAQKAGAKVTTGLLPAGNANDHYHNLRNQDMVKKVVSGETTKIDLMKLESVSEGQPVERYAHSYIGLGLTSQIAKVLNSTKLNPISEVWIVLRSLFRIKSVSLEIDGQVKRYDSLIFSNIDKMSKVLKISQKASLSDGLFEVTIFPHRKRWQLIAMLLKASIQGVEEDLRTSQFTLKTVNTTGVQLDGEVIMLDSQAETSVTIDNQVLDCLV